MLAVEHQKDVTGTVARDNPPKRTFDEQVEAAEKEPNEGRRDQQLTFAVTNNSTDVPVERVVAVIEKIADRDNRFQLSNWFYFKRSQALIDKQQFDEARKLAAKTTELDQRAFLYAKIAEGFLKENADQTQARELLNELSDAATKAPKTIVTGRARLALANLYMRIDPNRGVEELANAIKTINTLEAPDFSVEYVTMKIEGKTFGSYSGFSTPGFNPENVFKDIAKIDFDGSLIQAATFTDKALRAMTTMAVIEPCFEIVKSEPKTPKKKP
jgi:tetratricopeptide (TPR) repeat protein